MENDTPPRRTPEEFDFILKQKNARITYLHSKGRISEEEYEKWLLSDSIDFEPVVKSSEEVKEEWVKLLFNQPLHFATPKEDQIVILLEKISKQLEAIYNKV